MCRVWRSSAESPSLHMEDRPDGRGNSRFLKGWPDRRGNSIVHVIITINHCNVVYYAGLSSALESWPLASFKFRCVCKCVAIPFFFFFPPSFFSFGSIFDILNVCLAQFRGASAVNHIVVATTLPCHRHVPVLRKISKTVDSTTTASILQGCYRNNRSILFSW